MELLKKYSSLLMPAGLILFGVGLLVVTILMSSSTKADMEQSLSVGKRIESLRRNVVSREQWRKEQERQQEHIKDTEAIKRAAEGSCRRELLSYKIFPLPESDSQQIFTEFGKNYRLAVEGFISKMRAGECPSEAEVSKVTRSRSGPASEGSRQLMPSMRFGSGSVARRSKRDESVDRQIWNKLCEARAREILVYADPSSSFKGYDFWGDYEYIGRDTAIEACWRWQVAIWIQQDIADMLSAMNRQSQNIFTSPVKRLLRISFHDSSGETHSRVDKGEAPGYVDSFETGLVKPCTGRVCGDDIDVVHFSFSVVLDSRSVGHFMHELCRGKKHKFLGYSGNEQEREFEHNQITILEFSMEPVEKSKAYEEGYRYGDDPVVRLRLVCEYVFDRAGYDAIKPESIKKLLGQVKEEKPEEDAGRGSARRRRARKKSASTRGKKEGESER